MPEFDKSPFFRDRLKVLQRPELYLSIWKECRPHLLVVTDGLSFDSSATFGLTQFVSTLENTLIHGMLPIVTKASRGGDPNADVTSFRFDDATHGVLKKRYDVVFILGINSVADASPSLPAGELDAIAKFMQDGGGVFATGDHDALGSAISRDIPRVRSMRHWKNSDTPNAADRTRISTNVSGSNEVEDFDDQSDAQPQNLYPNFRTVAGNPGIIPNPALAHPLLQLPARPGAAHPVVEVFPDHPHEGECRVPSDLTTTFELGKSKVSEWPDAIGGGSLSPEVVARCMSHGSGFPGKEALEPRSYISVCAYDGHLADVGRVSTDSTWHHFVNVNLDGSGGGPGQIGLRVPGASPGDPPVDSDALVRIRGYYGNLANWLMPEKTRRCLRFPFLLRELVRYPLFEEIEVPVPPIPPDPDPWKLVQLGRQVADSLALRYPAWLVQSTLLDALTEAVGEKSKQRYLRSNQQFGKLGPLDIALGALGAVTMSLIETLQELRSTEEIVPHKTFEPKARAAAKTTARRLVEWQRKELVELDSFLKELQEAE